MAAPFREAGMGIRNDVRKAHHLSLLLDRTQRCIDRCYGDISVARGQLVRFSSAAALGEHVELGSEHVTFRNADLLSLRITIPAALNVEGRGLVQLGRRVP